MSDKAVESNGSVDIAFSDLPAHSFMTNKSLIKRETEVSLNCRQYLLCGKQRVYLKQKLDFVDEHC